MDGGEDEDAPEGGVFLDVEGVEFLDDGDDGDGPPPPESDDEEGDEYGAEGGVEGDDDGEGEGEGGGVGVDGTKRVAAAAVDDLSALTFDSHAGPVYCVASRSLGEGKGAMVASGGGDDLVFLWTHGGGGGGDGEGRRAAPLRLAGHTDSVVAVGFDSAGELLASAAMDGVTIVWDAATGAEVSRLEGPGDALEWGYWHPRGPVYLAGTADGQVWMWNARSAECMNVLAGHSGAVTCGSFAPDGKTAVTASADGSVRVWDPRSAAVLQNFAGARDEPVTALALSALSPLAISGAESGRLQLLQLKTGKCLGTLAGHTDSIESVAFASFGGASYQLVASGSMDCSLRVWDVNSLQIRSVYAHDSGVVKVCWHPTEPLLVSAVADGDVLVWDTRSNTARKLTGHVDCILDCVVTADAIVSASDDETAKVWKL